MSVTFTVEQAKAQHPQFHITPESGWMNDPNGMFQLGALYHVFFQYNPAAAVWGAPTWGHVVSSDLAHWQQLPVALQPDTVYDNNGVFSGSATVVNGTPILLYTDQFLFFASRIGGQQDCTGSAMMYSSPPGFLNWEYVGLLASQVGSDATAECQPAPNSQSCDPVGAACRSWECPDFFAVPGLNGRYALKWSDHCVLRRSPFGADWVVLGDAPASYAAADTINSGKGAFTARPQGVVYPPRLLDYGSIYASKSFRVGDGRQVMMSWVVETSVGCSEQCTTGTAFTNASGWQGVQTIPRSITYDADDELLFYPVVEVEQLRQEILYQDNVILNQASDFASLPFANKSNDGHQLDVVLNITLEPPPALSDSGSSSSTFETGAILLHDSATSTRVLNGTISRPNSGVWTVTSLGVFVNKSLTGGATNVTYQDGFEGGAVGVPSGGLALDNLSLRVLVDHSLLEVFANEGRGRIASRIYPLSSGNWTAALFAVMQSAAGVSVNAAVYAMESCWVASVY